jgi:hypothetical protein
LQKSIGADKLRLHLPAALGGTAPVALAQGGGDEERDAQAGALGKSGEAAGKGEGGGKGDAAEDQEQACAAEGDVAGGSSRSADASRERPAKRAATEASDGAPAAARGGGSGKEEA